LETGWKSGMVVAILWTMNDRKRLFVPISAPAVASLVIAPNALIPKRPGSVVIRLDPFEMEDPVEAPLLADYVGVVALQPPWRVLEFLNENSQRVMFSISSKPFRQLLSTLKISVAKH